MKQTVGWTMLVLGILVGLAGGFMENKIVLTAGIVAAFVGLVAQAFQFRCPKCGRRVATDRYGNRQRCPHCGEELEQP